LFRERIEAWASGPVIPTLFHHHKGKFNINARNIPGDIRRLSKDEKETIDAVLAHYGNKSAQWLIDLSHLEDPWKTARKGCIQGDRCNKTIKLADMMDYYSGL
jgi:uncharacterized phage-associated protein